MKCPKCKKVELKEVIDYKQTGVFRMRFYKIYTFFCPLCDYEKKKEIEINIVTFKAEMKMLKKKSKEEEASAEVDIGGISVRTKGKKKK